MRGRSCRQNSKKHNASTFELVSEGEKTSFQQWIGAGRSMDFFQSPSPNDQRRFSATELAIGVNPAELNAPWPDTAPQPTPVNQTTLVPSAKTLELMRQLEALAHEIALVSRGDSSNQCIKVEEGSNFSGGLQLVGPSIRVSPCDQMASDSPLFGRRTNLTLAGFFTAARSWWASSRTSLGMSSDTLAGLFIVVRNWLASRRPSFGKPSATLANLFIAARDWLASRRPSFGKPSATLANLFIAARDWFAGYRPSFDRPSATLAGFFTAARVWFVSSRTSLGRPSDTLGGLFITARDWFASYRRSFGSRTPATPASFFMAALIGVAVAFVWQSQLVSTATSPNDVTVGEKQSDFTPIGHLSVQDGPPRIASVTQTAPASTEPATSSELVQQLEDISRDLVVLRRRVEELAAKQEHLIDAQEQLAARQEQIAQSIAKPQPVKQNINNKMSSPPRRNALAEPAAQASFLPRPRPSLSVTPDRR
jgi:hypothetical protein